METTARAHFKITNISKVAVPFLERVEINGEKTNQQRNLQPGETCFVDYLSPDLSQQKRAGNVRIEPQKL